jgi:hypothetical protein
VRVGDSDGLYVRVAVCGCSKQAAPKGGYVGTRRAGALWEKYEITVSRQVISHDLNLFACTARLALKEQGVLQACELTDIERGSVLPQGAGLRNIKVEQAGNSAVED